MATRKPAAAPAARTTSNLPISVVEQLAAQVREQAGKTAPPSGDRVRFSKGKYVLPDGGEGETFRGIILDFISTNNFWGTKYDPKNISPPVCFALGPKPKELVPSENSFDKQADSCAVCPMNEFGSDGAGKACKNARLFALIPIMDLEEGEKAPLWLFAVPPTGIKYFDKLVTDLTLAKLAPMQAIVEFSLDNSTEYFSPRFTRVGITDDVTLASTFERLAEAQARLNTEPDTSSLRVEAPKPAARKAPAKRAGAR